MGLADPSTAQHRTTQQGVDAAKQELQEVVDFLKNPGKYKALGAPRRGQPDENPETGNLSTHTKTLARTPRSRCRCIGCAAAAISALLCA